MKSGVMKSITKRLRNSNGIGYTAGLAVLFAALMSVPAQWPSPPATNPTAQRNAMNLVVNQIKWLQSAIRTSGSYAGGGYGNLQEQFQAVRDRWASFETTLTPQQLNAGGDRWAELDEGLDVISEAFADFQTAVASGKSEINAYHELTRVLNQGIGLWGRQFNQTCRELRVGW